MNIGDNVIVNKNILEYFYSLKVMYGRVGIIIDIIGVYVLVEFTGDTNKYQNHIPLDCLDECSDKEYIKRGTLDEL